MGAYIKPARLLLFSIIWLLGVTSFMASAHVKWFTEWSFADEPLWLDGLITPTKIGLLIFTMVALAIAVVIDTRMERLGWYKGIVQWFETRKEHAPLVMRIGMGMTFLLAWQAETLLSPDLATTDQLVGWGQYFLALMLIFPRTTPLAGLGTLILYGVAVVQFGAFYMLDYFIFAGVAVYLMVAQSSNERIRALRIPALYFSVGFSLFWLGLEKLIYPQWGLALLAEYPILALGFPPDFFLTGAAFVEMALGFLFIIGLLERPMAIVVTVVFILTTTIFGRIELIGHTIIHAALIAFLLEGTKAGGPFRPPIAIHRTVPWRAAFSSVNFALVFAVLVVPYALMAQAVFAASSAVAFYPLMRALWN